MSVSIVFYVIFALVIELLYLGIRRVPPPPLYPAFRLVRPLGTDLITEVATWLWNLPEVIDSLCHPNEPLQLHVAIHFLMEYV